MALDSDKVRVAVTGAVYVAPTGSQGPSYADDSLTNDWDDLGYVSADGITENIDRATTQIRSWQDGSLVREITSEGTYSVSLTFIETNQDVLQLYYGTALTSGAANIDPRETGGRKMFVIDVIDGINIERTYIPNGEVTSIGERTLASGEAIGYEVTITAYADASKFSFKKFFSQFGSVEP
jgi:hypothetical protein